MAGRTQALAEKEQGNAAYKARDFVKAKDHYEKAWDLDKDITFLNNLSGKYLSSCFLLSLLHAFESVSESERGKGCHRHDSIIPNANERTNERPLFIHITAVYFEQADYDQAIKTCTLAVDEGRDRRADFKLIAKYVPSLPLSP